MKLKVGNARTSNSFTLVCLPLKFKRPPISLPGHSILYPTIRPSDETHGEYMQCMQCILIQLCREAPARRHGRISESHSQHATYDERDESRHDFL